MFNNDFHAVCTNRWTRLTRIALTPAAGLLMLAGCHNDYDDRAPRVVEHRVIEERPVYVPQPATPPDPHSYSSEPPPVDVETTPPAAQPPAGYSSYSSAPGVAVTEEVRYEPPPAEVYTTYEADLNPYGRWVEVEQYGRCWVPNDRPSGWEPYTVGHWDYSDYGWTWVAEGNEADWGVVTYHYGRWFPDARHGWCWAPGTVWGPGWVGWREGNGYCGWCPLPPVIGDGFVVTPAIVDRHCPADRFVFCEERFLGGPRIHEHIVRNNVTIVNKTTNITNITFRDRKAINRGVDVSHVEKVAGRKIEKVSIAEAKDPREARQLLKQGKPVVYDPPQIQRAAQVVEERTRSREQDRRPGAAQPAAHRTGAQDDARTAAEQRAAQERANQQREAQQRNAREQVTHPQQQTPADIEHARQEAQARAAQERTNQERVAQERAAEERAAKERAAQAERERRNPTPPREREAEPAGHRVPAEQPPTPAQKPREEPRVQPREEPRAQPQPRTPAAAPPPPRPPVNESTPPREERPAPQPQPPAAEHREAPHPAPAPAAEHREAPRGDGGREDKK